MAKRDRTVFVQGALAFLAFCLLLGAAAKNMEPPSRALEPHQPEEMFPLSPSAQDRQQTAPTADGKNGQQDPAQRHRTELVPSTSREGVFHGTIERDPSGYVFRDQSEIVYRLDSPERAKPFQSKPVRITGRIDQAKRLIYVVGIEPAQG